MLKRQAICGIVIDQSGSMSGIADQAVSGVNEYLETIASDIPDAIVIISFFNLRGVNVLDKVPRTPVTIVRRGNAGTMAKIARSEYKPGGLTPLLDAIGQVTGILDKEASGYVNPMVFMAVMTDGYENASIEHTNESVSGLINARKAAGWDIKFLASDIQAVNHARSLGVSMNSSATYAVSNTRGAIKGVALETVSAYTAETESSSKT